VHILCPFRTFWLIQEKFFFLLGSERLTHAYLIMDMYIDDESRKKSAPWAAVHKWRLAEFLWRKPTHPLPPPSRRKFAFVFFHTKIFQLFQKCLWGNLNGHRAITGITTRPIEVVLIKFWIFFTKTKALIKYRRR
jgi:hypothetical protein